MADLSIGGGNTPRIDTEKWKRLTPQEIIKEESKGEEIPAEIIAWAQQMVAFSKIPDNVTYEMVDGDIGLDALDRLGIEDEDLQGTENATRGSETEDPDAVRDPARAENGELPPEGDEPVPAPAQPGQASDAEPTDEDDLANDEFSLADDSLVTDPDEIRKRKERKGIQQ